MRSRPLRHQLLLISFFFLRKNGCGPSTKGAAKGDKTQKKREPDAIELPL
jgi:hypothetical protein